MMSEHACAGRLGRSLPGNRSLLQLLPGWRGRPTDRQFPAPERHLPHAHTAIRGKL